MAQDQHAVDGKNAEWRCLRFDLLLVGIVSPCLLPVPPSVGIVASFVGYGIYAVTQLQSTSADTEPPLGGHIGRTD